MPFMKQVDIVAETLKCPTEKLFKWGKDNQMKGNIDKYNLI